MQAMANVQSMHIAEGSPVKKLLKDSQLDTLVSTKYTLKIISSVCVCVCMWAYLHVL